MLPLGPTSANHVCCSRPGWHRRDGHRGILTGNTDSCQAEGCTKQSQDQRNCCPERELPSSHSRIHLCKNLTPDQMNATPRDVAPSSRTGTRSVQSVGAPATFRCLGISGPQTNGTWSLDVKCDMNNCGKARHAMGNSSDYHGFCVDRKSLVGETTCRASD